MLRKLFHWLCSLLWLRKKEADESCKPSIQLSIKRLTDWLKAKREERKLRIRTSLGKNRWIMEADDFPEVFLLFSELSENNEIKVKESAGVIHYTSDLPSGATLTLNDKVRNRSNEIANLCLYEPAQRKATLKILFMKRIKK